MEVSSAEEARHPLLRGQTWSESISGEVGGSGGTPFAIVSRTGQQGTGHIANVVGRTGTPSRSCQGELAQGESSG